MKQVLENSKKWICLNNRFAKFNRNEGLLSQKRFNEITINYLKNNYSFFEKINNNYLVGIELEFYIKQDKITELITELTLVIPEFKMLIESLDNVIESDGEQFFLIKERTGNPLNGYISLELITPKLDFRNVKYYLDVFLSILIKLEVKTDEHVGLHMHISTLNQKTISPIALLYYMDCNNVFDWDQREFVRDIISQFFEYSCINWQYLYESIIRKCYSVNFFEFHNNNRIEYRSPGGLNYIHESVKIYECFLSIIKSFEETFDSDLDKLEKKLREKYPLNKKVIKTIEISTKDLINQDLNDLLI